jgi:hypothetical protein
MSEDKHFTDRFLKPSHEERWRKDNGVDTPEQDAR